MKNVTYLCALVMLFTVGCASNVKHVQRQHTRTDHLALASMPQTRGVHTFFKGEPVAFTYKKVGIIEVSNEYYLPREAMLDQMKYEAWEAGANGIINITSTVKYEPRTYKDKSGYYDRTYFAEVHVYTGTAVIIKEDKTFLEQYGNLNDSTFVNQLRQENTDMKKSRKAGLIGIGAALVIMSILTFGG